MRKHVGAALLLQALLFSVPSAKAAGEIDFRLLDTNAPAKAANAFNEGQEQARRRQMQVENDRREAALRNAEAQRSQAQAQAQATLQKDPGVALMEKPDGLNLLRLIEAFNNNKNSAQPSSFFLLGFFFGAEHAMVGVNLAATIVTGNAKPALDKLGSGKKLTKDDEAAIAMGRAAKGIAPISMMEVPASVSLDQKIAITEKYLREHPEKLHLSAYWLILAALDSAFKPGQ